MTTIAGRYVLLQPVGAGGAATVYKAHDERLNREVAVKLLSPALALDPVALERFTKEAHRAASVFHPNLLAVYDFGVADSQAPYIVMELGDGRNLHQVIKSDGPLEPAAAGAMVASVCDALGAIHDAGMIHRDVKPANILIGSAVKLADFGIAIDSIDAGDLTQTGFIAGTPSYVAPERLRGEPSTFAVDIYAAGCVLFESMVGSAPFAGPDLATISLAHANELAPLASAVNPNIPSELDSIIARALDKDPARRFSNADEMASALRDAIAPSAVRAAGATLSVPAIVDASASPTVTQFAANATSTTVAPLPIAPRNRMAEAFRWTAIGIAALAALWVALFVGSLLFSPAGSLDDARMSPAPDSSAEGFASPKPRTTAEPSPTPEETAVPDDDKKTKEPRLPDLPGLGRRDDDD